MENFLIVTISAIVPVLLGYSVRKYIDRNKPPVPKPPAPVKIEETSSQENFDVTDFNEEKKNPYSEN